MILRFGRFRFRPEAEADGFEVLRRHAEDVASADGCESAVLAQGQHPSTEFVLIAMFRDEETARRFEGRVRSDPSLGGPLFAAIRLTTQPPEMAQYEVRIGPDA